MEKNTFDLIVIGTGPGGEGAAMKAAKSGKTVAAIERYSRVGGGAVHWGTIPSKALRRQIHNLSILVQSPAYKNLDIRPEFSFPEMVAGANGVIEQQTDLREGFYDRNSIPTYYGDAALLDANKVVVRSESHAPRILNGDKILIASGSRPYRPGNIDFQHPRIFDSDTLLGMKFTPRSIIIYGAGVIGCEYASMLRNMGIDVTLVDTRERLLNFLDDEMSDALSYHFSDSGITIMHSEEYEKVEGREKDVVIQFKSGKKLRAEAFLWANGRSGNTTDMGLEAVGVAINKRGQLEVNENFQVKKTTEDGSTQYFDHIYAVGDVIGFPALASAAYDQGRLAASHICGDVDYRLAKDIPAGIYTTPEISSLGKTERELTAEKVPYAVGKASFKSLARAQITGQTVGMLKLLFHRDTLELLGIHCFGENAAEIIHIGQAIMTQPKPNNTINYFVHTTFNYPTMAEAYRVAALKGLYRLVRD